ncbi:MULTISPECIES: Spo0B domain-containing protein [unclassified Virgibacillus]|uniref:Spo0B domain-containing protein n=1 Tax=unclassified Virgibacillus TaxID=2620237 RepID=UPI0024DE8CA3|nr:Spo0B domain-containing protein [Virgibacillus sp. LDC-1]
MESKDVMMLLRHIRHDVMNDMQVIQGYLSMGKSDKVQSKITRVLERYEEERKLMNLNTPHFALWLIGFNAMHTNIRLTYEIDAQDMNLNRIDNELVKQCNQLFEAIEACWDRTQLHEAVVRLKGDKVKHNIEVQIVFERKTDCISVQTLLANYNQENIGLFVNEAGNEYRFVFNNLDV